MQEKYYYHAIAKDTIKTLDCIFKIKAILSNRNLYGTNEALNKAYNCNGIDFISVTARSKAPIPNEEKSFYAWYEWPEKYISIVLTSRIDAIKTLCLYDTFKDEKIPDGYNILTTDTKIRYSAFKDEWHVKDRIDFNNFIGISYPLTIELEKTGYMRKTTLSNLRELQKVLINNNINLPLYDLTTMEIIPLNSSIKALERKKYDTKRSKK